EERKADRDRSAPRECLRSDGGRRHLRDAGPESGLREAGRLALVALVREDQDGVGQEVLRPFPQGRQRRARRVRRQGEARPDRGGGPAARAAAVPRRRLGRPDPRGHRLHHEAGRVRESPMGQHPAPGALGVLAQEAVGDSGRRRALERLRQIRGLALNRPRRLAAALWVGVSLTHAAAGLTPMSSYHDLVAGAGEAGFLDGDFYRARFHAPAGLAFVERRGALFVSDRDNHRVRAIWLNENNRVTVLAGTGEKGNRDGTFELATFDSPAAMVAVSDHLLIVNDEGNAVFRALDLEKRSVTTLAGNFGRGVAEGAATGVPLGGVFSLLFVPAQNAVYFSQPEFHALRSLDLKSKTVSTVVKDDSRLPNPTALALFGGKLCVADSSG